jgi:DNA-binding CsgD family transcriptional regulator
VGRKEESAAIHTAAERLGLGEGAVVWVEGQPGIGKSSLVAVGAAAARAAGCDVLWATADQLSQPFPLRVMLDCLQVQSRSPDPRRAEIAKLLGNRRPGLLGGDDIGYAQSELLITLVDELCTASPTMVVVDDLQWADEMSLMVWHRLAHMVDQLPLLLVATCHTAAHARKLQEVRASVMRRDDCMISLGPLADNDVAALVTGLAGVTPESALALLSVQAMGNPLYIRELVDALVRERVLGVGLVNSELADALRDRIPPSFAAALNDRLSLLPPGSAETLRMASLLGVTFTVTDLVVLLGRSASELSASLQDAVAAGITVGVDGQMAFRSPLIRQVLYDGIPEALRAALHRDAARSLADAGAEPLRVAEQLMASGHPGDAWGRDWLAENAALLAARAPDMTAELLQRDVDQHLPNGRNQKALAVGLARVLLSPGRHAEAAARARQALAMVLEPEHRAEMYWVLTRALFSLGRYDEAIETVQRALAWPQLHDSWRARLLASLAMFQRAETGDVDGADATAREALHIAEDAPDAFATAYALTDLWFNQSTRRDHASALRYLDRALEVLGEGPSHADLRAFALDGRIFTLQNLARWTEAESTMRRARDLELRIGYPTRAASAITAAVLLYWLGRWDDAMAELGYASQEPAELTYSGLRERGPALLWHGVAALIAGRRNDRATSDEHLRAGLALPFLTISDRENSDFLIAGQALAIEQLGDPAGAQSVLSTILDRKPGEMTLTHQWLPDLVRVSIEAGDRRAARTALNACQAEAAAEVVPARAFAAARRCQGMYDGDTAPLQQAVEHYRAVGALVELAGSLEDLAAVLASHGQDGEAKTAFNEAVTLYSGLGAEWDIQRADQRLRAFGIRRGARGPRGRRGGSGWEALTPTELKIATQVAEGESTPNIARNMFLSPRTVQTHISHILSKLGARGRVEIAVEFHRRAG